MTQYPDLSYPPLCNPVDPYAPSAPYSPVLYHVDADSRRFVSPLTWRPPLMAQALPTMYLSAITTIHIRPYSGGVPLTIDDEALALIKVSDNNRNPLHLSYATPINNEYYEVIIDLIDHSDITYVGQGYMELTINNTVMLSDKCVIRAPLFPSNEQPPSPYGTIINVTDGTITLSTTPTLYQLSPIPSDQTELNLTFTPSSTDNIHKLLFHSEAPSLVINVDGASISGHYTGPGWYCAMVEESGSIITINLERLTDFTTESVYTVKGFNTILVEDEWPTYGRLDTLYIHTLTREARIWKNEEWWPVGSSEYKYAPKSDSLPLPTGVASKGIEEQYAAGDHVHPFSIELTANHLDTDFTTPTDTHVPSSKLVKDTIDQVKSDLEDEISSLSGGIDVTALNGKVDKVEGKELSTNDYTTEDKNKVATIQSETLITINGITAEIEPWSRSRWTIQGDCSITLSDDWNTTGKEHAYILVTLKTGATLSVPSTVVFDNYLDQGEGVYEVELINLDGVVHFRWTECYPVNSIKFYVTTTLPNQTYTINTLVVSTSTDVGWGDGSLDTYTGSSSRSHVYPTPGTYEVRILPAENITFLELQGELVSEVNSEDLKAASNIEQLRLMNLTAATGSIDTAVMSDWPMTRHFYIYNNPLLSINVDSAHMVGWNPTVIYLYNLTNGNVTINTEDMAGWTNLENIVLQALPTLGGSLDTLHFAGWSNFRSLTLYRLSAAFSVRFHTEDLIELPIQVLHLFDYDGRNTAINTADLSTKAVVYFRLYKLPLSVVTVNSADMLLWDLSYLSVSTLPQTTGTIDFADLAGFNLGTFALIGCPLLTLIEDQSAFLSWTSLTLLQITNCTFSTEQMDHTLYYLYTAAPSRTVTGGTISFAGTLSSAPSGVYGAPDCPVISSTPGRGIAYALKNDSCSIGFNKWATVTVK